MASRKASACSAVNGVSASSSSVENARWRSSGASRKTRLMHSMTRTASGCAFSTARGILPMSSFSTSRRMRSSWTWSRLSSMMTSPRWPSAELVHLLELDPGDVHGEVVEAVLVRLVADHKHRVRGQDVEVLPVGEREAGVVREGHVRHAGPGVDVARVLVGLVLRPDHDQHARVVLVERLHGHQTFGRRRLAGPQLARDDRPDVERVGAGLVVEGRLHLRPDMLESGRA